MIQTNVFVDEVKKTLEYYAVKVPSCTVFVTELVAGSCLDFVVAEGEDFKNHIEWYASRREGYLVREPLSKKELAKLERKYRMETDSFSDKQWGQGYSVTIYGDGMYGLGPGAYSMIVDEGWILGEGAKYPNIKMSYPKLQGNLADAGIPGQPLIFTGTPGVVNLDSLLSRPSSIDKRTPLFGLSLHFCANESREIKTIDVPGPEWRKEENA